MPVPLLVSYEGGKREAYPVARVVDSPKNELDKGCVEPAV